MILNRMESDNQVAVIKRRAGSVFFSLPKPEDGIVCTAHISEEEVITDVNGVRYAEVPNPLVEAIDPDNDMEMPLYDTTKIAVSDRQSFEDAMASIDTQEAPLDAQIGTFTYRDLTNMLYSLYAFFDTHRADPKPVTDEDLARIAEEQARVAENPDGDSVCPE